MSKPSCTRNTALNRAARRDTLPCCDSTCANNLGHGGSTQPSHPGHAWQPSRMKWRNSSVPSSVSMHIIQACKTHHTGLILTNKSWMRYKARATPRLLFPVAENNPKALDRTGNIPPVRQEVMDGGDSVTWAATVCFDGDVVSSAYLYKGQCLQPAMLDEPLPPIINKEKLRDVPILVSKSGSMDSDAWARLLENHVVPKIKEHLASLSKPLTSERPAVFLTNWCRVHSKTSSTWEALLRKHHILHVPLPSSTNQDSQIQDLCFFRETKKLRRKVWANVHEVYYDATLGLHSRVTSGLEVMHEGNKASAMERARGIPQKPDNRGQILVCEAVWKEYMVMHDGSRRYLAQDGKQASIPSIPTSLTAGPAFALTPLAR
eukprot:m.57478 g.57478  ORF g.57478 m.57478 type:complete len:376 (+) comp12745_c0_seq1:319-1446(+)